MRDPNENSPAARRFRLSRRTFLRGVGVTMALPWMESLKSFGSEPAKNGAAEVLPKRMAALFWGNGVNGNHWWAKGSGQSMELSKSLQPMEALKGKMNLIDGLFNRSAVGVGIHPGQTGNLLSGMPLMKGAVLKGGISMDQVIANHIGQDSIQPSMVLGCEQPITGYHETNFSMAYSSHISWQSPDSPVPMEVYPSLAFDSLFENRGSQRTRSILDRVKDEASSLGRRVSSTDKAKLDEYLTSVREVEKRVDRMRTDKAKADLKGQGKSIPVVMMKRPDNGLPEDIREHMRLMCDITAMAFQTDKTRVVSLLLCRDLSGLFYPFLDVRKAHHAASHDDLSDDFERVTRFYCSQLAYLAGRLEAMPEGEGTVLDNSCLLLLSNMWSGNRHDSTRLPILTVGGLGGTLQTGRVLNYLDKGDENRKVCSLYLSLMNKMGVKLNHFGDADTQLAEV